MKIDFFTLSCICAIVGALLVYIGEQIRTLSKASDDACYDACGTHSSKDVLKKRIGIFVIIIGLSLLFVGLPVIQHVRITEHQKKLIAAIENGYVIYINGTEVSANTINIEEYSNITIDKENQFIIITLD